MDGVLYFCKKNIGILIATVLNLSIILGGIDILTILSSHSLGIIIYYFGFCEDRR